MILIILKGKNPEFINQDDQSRRWLNDFRTKPFAVPLQMEIIDRKWIKTIREDQIEQNII